MPHGVSGDEVTVYIESVVDCTVGENETLGLTLGFEALHFPLSSSLRQMRIFDPVVVSQPPRFVALKATDLKRCLPTAP